MSPTSRRLAFCRRISAGGDPLRQLVTQPVMSCREYSVGLRSLMEQGELCPGGTRHSIRGCVGNLGSRF